MASVTASPPATTPPRGRLHRLATRYEVVIAAVALVVVIARLFGDAPAPAEGSVVPASGAPAPGGSASVAPFPDPSGAVALAPPPEVAALVPAPFAGPFVVPDLTAGDAVDAGAVSDTSDAAAPAAYADG